ncbi:restriction endonuclease subunit S [Clostridium perfringens]|uniref:restriction endonuclease subunit S n=1 Tax=Clostridium perfringens TaxID=1502 RepID=UPI002247FCEC|nr:restriction endonuclease subunit S [Clostridium perfringens]MCX0392311.1 restriction endonuclease subunit S [Clostridium perfringens]
MKLKDIFENPISGEWGKEVGEGEKGSKVIRTTNFTNIGRLDLSSVVERDIDLIKNENKKLKFGDIIIEKSGGSPTQPVGRVVIFEETNDEVYFCNNFTSILRPNKNIVPKFGLYLLKDLYNKKKVLKFQNKTTGIINIKLNDYLNNTEITIPNLEVQNRIIEVLNKTQELIDKRKEQIESLDELVKSKFIEMFGEVDDYVPLSKYINSLTAGKSLAGETECVNKVLNTGSISYDFFDKTQVKNLPKDYLPKEEHLVNKGDVLISRMNTAELVGATAYVWNVNDNTYIPDRLWKANFNDNINPIFVWQLLIQNRTKEKIRRIASGTSGSMKNISKTNLLNIEVIYVDICKQNQFADFVKQVDKLKFEMEKSLKDLEDNFNSLMQKAFKGELFN